MSAFEELFIRSADGDPGRTASQLAGALGFRLSHVRGSVFVGTDTLNGTAGHIGGRVGANVLRMDDVEGPEDVAIYDDMPLTWSLWSEDHERQRQNARVVFDLVVDRLGWPCVLVHDIEELVATFDPERGVREFPPGTRADARDRDIWG